MLKKIIIGLLCGVALINTTVYAQPITEAESYLAENAVEVPEEIAELCEYYGARNGISPELLEAVIWKESRFCKGAIDGSRTCMGLMQINTKAHAKRMAKFKVTNPFDPAGNIAVGSDYLGELLQDNSVEVALMLYNGDKRAHNPNYISKYARKVLSVSEALERVNGK